MPIVNPYASRQGAKPKPSTQPKALESKADVNPVQSGALAPNAPPRVTPPAPVSLKLKVANEIQALKRKQAEILAEKKRRKLRKQEEKRLRKQQAAVMTVGASLAAPVNPASTPATVKANETAATSTQKQTPASYQPSMKQTLASLEPAAQVVSRDPLTPVDPIVDSQRFNEARGVTPRQIVPRPSSQVTETPNYSLQPMQRQMLSLATQGQHLPSTMQNAFPGQRMVPVVYEMNPLHALQHQQQIIVQQQMQQQHAYPPQGVAAPGNMPLNPMPSMPMNHSLLQQQQQLLYQQLALQQHQSAIQQQQQIVQLQAQAHQRRVYAASAEAARMQRDRIDPGRLCLCPCREPSPFRWTHQEHKGTIQLIKDKTWGMVIRERTAWGLVAAGQWPRLNDPPESRRKRMPFTVIMVTEAAVQNDRQGKAVLEVGDIIVSINGSSLNGRFEDVCAFFKKSDVVSIEIARRRGAVPRPAGDPAPVYRDIDTMVNRQKLVESMLDSMVERANLGLGIFEAAEKWLPSTSAEGHPAAPQQWKNLWLTMVRTWMMYPPSSQVPVEVLERERKRKSPAEAGRCRCGSNSHFHVNHPDCKLYEELRCWVPEVFPQKTSVKKQPAAAVGVVEAAKEERKRNIKDSLNATAEEKIFIARMQDVQVRKMQKAVKSPTVQSILLSAVVELQSDFSNWSHKTVKAAKKQSAAQLEIADDSDDDSDDDDIPLTALNKDMKEKKESKTPSNDVCFSKYFLGRLLKFISDRWGDVYQEPTHEDHSW